MYLHGVVHALINYHIVTYLFTHSELASTLKTNENQPSQIKVTMFL